MNERPKHVVIASAAAIFGVFFAAVVTAMTLIDGADGLATSMSFCLLSLVLFLGIFGSLNKNGQWSWRFTIFMAVLCAAVPIMAYIYGAMDLVFMVILVLLASVVIIFMATGDAEDWVETDRL